MNRLLIVLVYTQCLAIRSAVPQFNYGQQYFQIPSMSGLPGMPPMSGMPGLLPMSGALQIPSISQVQSLSAIPSTSFYSSSSFGSIPSSVYETYGRRSRHHKLRTAKKKSSEIDNDESSDLSGECKCSCNKCDKPKSCCIPVCEQCNLVRANSGSVMLVPYAYPVFLTHPQDKNETTLLPATTDRVNNELDDLDLRLMKILRIVQSATHETNTTICATKHLIPAMTTTVRSTSPTTRKTETSIRKLTTTNTIQASTTTSARTTTHASEEITTEAPVTQNFRDSNKLNYDDDIYEAAHQDNKSQLTSMRRMKNNYLPKYGVLPIPNDVAERLLQKIRSEKIFFYRNIPLNTRIGNYQDEYDIE